MKRTLLVQGLMVAAITLSCIAIARSQQTNPPPLQCQPVGGNCSGIGNASCFGPSCGGAACQNCAGGVTITGAVCVDCEGNCTCTDNGGPPYNCGAETDGICVPPPQGLNFGHCKLLSTSSGSCAQVSGCIINPPPA